MDEKRWMKKKVYLETVSGRKYSGNVVAEDEVKIILLDKFNKLVELSKIDIRLMQEEE
jgi:small nuclear ribonucleoprotein (snRNP)-like protein